MGKVKDVVKLSSLHEFQDSGRPVQELSEEARNEFWELVEKAKTKFSSTKVKSEQEGAVKKAYFRLMGRIGCHPLIELPPGKKALVPRMMVDRDEVWVWYKPPMWQMAGSDEGWKRNIESKMKKHPGHRDTEDFSTSDLSILKPEYLKSKELECLQEWHALTYGWQWIDRATPLTGFGFVQRLDAETDGPVIVCKTFRSQRCIQVQMREHVFNKGYLCLVHGKVKGPGYVKDNFAELKGDENSQVLLRHDQFNDPFFLGDDPQNKRERGGVKQAETFYKPLAYYKGPASLNLKRNFTLVYVNILSGITHQIRITMQSIGHPLVSDDRYLPREQAMSDLKWCPRNFLTEVRSDWFDMCGPHKDPKRMQYTRMSIENPLPKILQDVLTKRLSLEEVLDKSADLFLGPQYWAIGDEQLMVVNKHDESYRKKVIRWGQRRGIHAAALDRLLMLQKKEIDLVLSRWKAPDDAKCKAWVCPKCMAANCFGLAGDGAEGALQCRGGAGLKALAKEEKVPGQSKFQDRGKVDCQGERHLDPDIKMTPVRGYKDWMQDPTIALLMTVNPIWLDQRRKVIKDGLGLWGGQKPLEEEGTPATEELLSILQAALVENAKRGGFGIGEDRLKKIKGLEHIKLPLGEPPLDSPVRRGRLPGSGTGSPWTYSLRASERVNYTESYTVPTAVYSKSIIAKTHPLPEKMFAQVRQLRADKRAAEEERRLEKLKTVEEQEEEQRNGGATNGNGHHDSGDVAPSPKRRKTNGSAWEKIESKSKPGCFYYFNVETGETSTEVPQAILALGNGTNGHQTEEAVSRPPAADEIQWKRLESSSKPGLFYYFNPRTGLNEVNPPSVEPPWKILESKTSRGQWYYFNEETRESTVHPPPHARPAEKAPSPAKRLRTPSPVRNAAPVVKQPATDSLPDGWKKKESAKFPGKFFYHNASLNVTSWEKPTDTGASNGTDRAEWVKKESSSVPGQFYWWNAQTGESRMEAPSW